MSTLKFVASLPPGTEIVFDYAIPPSALSESDRKRHDDVARRAAGRPSRESRGWRIASTASPAC